MRIDIYLGENEKHITPLGLANAIIDTLNLSNDELKELGDYLHIYSKYNSINGGGMS